MSDLPKTRDGWTRYTTQQPQRFDRTVRVSVTDLDGTLLDSVEITVLYPHNCINVRSGSDPAAGTDIAIGS